MLLVMDTADIFQPDVGTESQLWRLTWDKIDTFLPHLRDEIIKPFEPGKHIEMFESVSSTSDLKKECTSPLSNSQNPGKVCMAIYTPQVFRIWLMTSVICTIKIKVILHLCLTCRLFFKCIIQSKAY